jgi:lipopolysaccharide/colanic/teichoic acid biosynthesis glycosyltransferase
MLKRGFDIILSFVGLILLCPVSVVIAVLIKLDSKGPVFYRQIRIGRDGKPFQMYKFRTMMEVDHWAGPPLSPRNDPRVTTIGSILRRTKLNELPQLMNVLIGDMSFVGPRPEVPEFVKLYDDEEKRILCVRPGIVGPSQILMRNEEELYEKEVKLERHYVDHIMLDKVKIDLEYVDNRSFWTDLGYLLRGVAITITGAISRRHLFENVEQIELFVCDFFVSALAYFLAYYLRFEGELPAIENAILLQTVPYVVVIRLGVFLYFGVYATLPRFLSSDEVIQIVKGATIGSMLIVLVTFLVGERGHPRSVFVIDWLVLLFIMLGYRVLFKVIRRYQSDNRRSVEEDLLIYGAGGMGDLALRYMRMRGGSRVVAFVDDDPRKMRKSFQGVKVLGTRYDIESLVKLYRIDHVLIAPDNNDVEDINHIKALCEKAGVTYEVFALAN